METERPGVAKEVARTVSLKRRIPLSIILATWIIVFPIGLLIVKRLETTIDWYHPLNKFSFLLIIASLVLFFVFAYIGVIPIRNQMEKRPGGFLSSFIILLYIEMYGFPLTTYVLIWLLGGVPQFIGGFHLFGKFGALVGEIFILVGGTLILAGWYEVFYGAPNTLLTDGLYGHVRHPQYLGILLATFGLLIHWITIILSILFPILVYLYYHLAKNEEAFLEEKFKNQFIRYKKTVPMFIPRLRKDHHLVV
ncbi:MAG: methyltransferase family protein [Candidatus Heimdallarchaeota archaeon]